MGKQQATPTLRVAVAHECTAHAVLRPMNADNRLLRDASVVPSSGDAPQGKEQCLWALNPTQGRNGSQLAEA